MERKVAKWVPPSQFEFGPERRYRAEAEFNAVVALLIRRAFGGVRMVHPQILLQVELEIGFRGYVQLFAAREGLCPGSGNSAGQGADAAPLPPTAMAPMMGPAIAPPPTYLPVRLFLPTPSLPPAATSPGP